MKRRPLNLADPITAGAASAGCGVCLPQEVEDISRRQMLRTGVSVTAYVSMAALLGTNRAFGQATSSMTSTGTGTSTAANPTYPPQRKIIWINMSGGWDLLESTDPKPASTAGIQMIYDYGQANSVPGATSDLRLGRWMPNIAAIGSDLLVIRGIAMGTTSHPAGSAYMDTSVLSPTGMVNAASIPAIVASESSATIPIIQLSGGNTPLTDRGLLNPVSVVRADNLALYQSMFPADDAAIQRRMAVLDYLKASAARVATEVGTSDRLTDLGAAEEKVRGQFQNNVGSQLGLTDADRAPFLGGAPKGTTSSTTDGVALALKLINSNIVTAVNIGFGGFDTHQMEPGRLQPILTQADFAIGKLVAGLRASGQLASTMIVMFSDFGRTPMVNAANGRDHWPVGGAIVIGGGIQGGRAVGGTADDTLAAADLVDPNTGLVTTDPAVGVQLNPTHLGGMVVNLTLGSSYMQYRPYLSTIPALLQLKSG